MKNKVYATMDEAVADIPDGSTIMCPGFSGVGVPRNLLAAVNRQGAKELTCISNNAGTLDELVDVGTLVEAGQVKKMICAFTAPTHPSMVTPFVRMYNEGLVDAELVPQGTLAERIRIAAAGIGGFYTPTSVGTELAEGKEHREIDTAGPTSWSTHSRRLRPGAGLEGRQVRQPAVPALAAQLQPHHGHGRQDHHRGSGERYSGNG